jgi:hypothetical protein
MGYFSYLADQSFKTGDGGKRLLFLAGPWSRPYVIPNADTERRVQQSLVRLLQITFGAIFALALFTPLWLGYLQRQPLLFLGCLVAVGVLFRLITMTAMGPELKALDRAPRRMPMAAFYGEVARTRSFGTLLMGFAACLLFVAGGAWMVGPGATGPNAGAVIGVGYISIVVFGFFALFWGYALWLKATS